jgi:hypothetical protein
MHLGEREKEGRHLLEEFFVIGHDNPFSFLRAVCHCVFPFFSALISLFYLFWMMPSASSNSSSIIHIQSTRITATTVSGATHGHKTAFASAERDAAES